MTKLFQVCEPDLQKLEYALPRLFAALGAEMNRPELQVLLEECKEVVSDIRWNYGPHTNVERI